MSDCINWSKGLAHNGYGLTTRNNKTYRAHRLAYCDYHNIDHSDLKGQVVRHTCDNRKCVNPEHLVIGTHQDNMDDMKKRNRSAKGLDNGSGKLTPEQVAYIRTHYVKRSKEFGTVALGRKFGVHNGTISRAVRGIYHSVEYGTNMMNKVDVE